MLKNITLSNFRKHTNSTYEFSDGLHVMRGSNEAGKSTLLEAIAYALFGVKALRSPLAEAVTWGQPENTLQVVLELDVDGVEYRITRSKSGAEINYGSGRVTGQTEVTNFISSKLRVDAGAAPKLMLSTQMDIRGALEAGPKATTELIEKLSEFDQIDHLIDVMQEKLTLGNTSLAAAELAAAEQRVQELSNIVEPDFAAMRAEVKQLNDAIAVANARANEVNQKHIAAERAHTEAAGVERQRQDLTLRSIQRGNSLKAAVAELGRVAKEEPPVVQEADLRIAELLANRDVLASQMEAARAYDQVLPLLNQQSASRFHGTASELSAKLELGRRSVTSLKALASAEDVLIAKSEAKLNNDTCSFCGKDFSELPEVREKNAHTQMQIDEARARKAASLAGAGKAQAEVDELAKFEQAGHDTDRLMSRYSKWLSADRSTVPAVYSWAGTIPDVNPVQPDYDAEIRNLRQAAKSRLDWEKAMETLDSSIRTLQREVDGVNSDLMLLPKVDSEQLALTASQLALEAREAAQSRDALRDEEHKAQETLRSVERAWARDVKALEDSKAAAQKAGAALKALEFNNALLKRVRAARPVIADKLWNLVLTSVSAYFSEMRGAPSRVTKTSDGFLVDGHPVASLSGSTLDILGLAIRVALVRTFLPQAPFLVLDEPCASMDQARTESLLGFLVAVGFQQTLLVTHEDVSESVADHIITL